MTLVNKILYISIFLFFFSCQDNVQKHSLNGFTQGTSYMIKYNHTDDVVSYYAIDSLLQNIELSMSSYIDNSLISLINKGIVVDVDSLLETVLKRSIEICHQTDGMFDVTIAPLVDYWGFGPDKIKKKGSSDNSISYSFNIGCDKIRLQNNQIIKPNEVTIDVNGIAQGFTVDYIAQYFHQMNIYDFMIEVGGEIRCSGDNMGDGWKIGIDKPTDRKRGFAFILNLKDISLATSGSYRNYYYSDSIKISHTINPKTLLPADNKLLSATILHNNCMSADAYATACMSFGFISAKFFLEKYKIPGCLIYVENNDTLNYFSSGFSSFLH